MKLNKLSLVELEVVDKYLEKQQGLISVKYQPSSYDYYDDQRFIELIAKRKKIYEEIGKRVSGIEF